MIFCMFCKKRRILTANEEVDRMEQARRKIHCCLFLVVLTAVLMGILYYCGQMEEQISVSEGSLVSNLGME